MNAAPTSLAEERAARIRERLTATLAPDHLEVIDEGHLHHGHKGAGGLGHFRVRIHAQQLAALPRVRAHRRIYEVMDDLMRTDVHALAIELLPAPVR